MHKVNNKDLTALQDFNNMYNFNAGSFSTVSQYDNSSSRRSISSPRKKRRKYSNESLNGTSNGSGSGQCHALSRNQTNNISIIDRVLDLNKYDSNTGLYSLCRDWINATTSVSETNKVYQAMEVEEMGTSETSKNSGYFIKELPEAAKDMDQPSICELNERIRVNIRSSQQSDMEVIKALNVSDDQEIQTHALLKLHVNYCFFSLDLSVCFDFCKFTSFFFFFSNR